MNIWYGHWGILKIFTINIIYKFYILDIKKT